MKGVTKINTNMLLPPSLTHLWMPNQVVITATTPGHPVDWGNGGMGKWNNENGFYKENQPYRHNYDKYTDTLATGSNHYYSTLYIYTGLRHAVKIMNIHVYTCTHTCKTPTKNWIRMKYQRCCILAK